MGCSLPQGRDGAILQGRFELLSDSHVWEFDHYEAAGGRVTFHGHDLSGTDDVLASKLRNDRRDSRNVFPVREGVCDTDLRDGERFGFGWSGVRMGCRCGDESYKKDTETE
jgi:hypothetical protein